MVSINSEIQAKLQRYEILERLGAGGMATVYRARDKNLGREVAIKLLHEHLVYEESFKERFEQEARLIAALNHPNIIQVFDFDMLEISNRTVYYMVMPFLAGTTLVDVLSEYRAREEVLPHERIEQITKDIASALDYAHQRGMIHRDVKPANIIFDDHNRAILTDFGIARLALGSGLTQEGMIVGTPAYMSPEQAIGQKVDGRSDIYALGVILYEMLTGRPPFGDDGTMSVLFKHASEVPPPVSEFMHMKNPALDIVLYNALEKDPDNRYQTGTALVQDLSAAIAGESTTQRLKPAALSSQVMHSEAVAGTKVLDAPAIPTNMPFTTRLTRALNAVVVRPARQNPTAFIAIAIAIVALLAVARIALIQPPVPTPSATQSASADSMTNDTSYFASDFSRDDMTIAHWEQSETGAERRIVDDGEYILSNTASGIAMTALYDPSHTFADASITLEGHLESSSEDPNSAYGIVFHYHDADNYNVFAVDGMGRYSIWVRENGRWIELRAAGENWTEHEGINLLGTSNILTLNIAGSTLTGYMNGVEVVTVEDETFADGGVGIYMATANGGSASAAIDRYVVEPLVTLEDNSQTDGMTDGMTDSMTDDESKSMTNDTQAEETEEP